MAKKKVHFENEQRKTKTFDMFRLIWFLWILFFSSFNILAMKLLWRCVATANNSSQSCANSIFEVHERAFARLICCVFFFSFIIFYAGMKNKFSSFWKFVRWYEKKKKQQRLNLYTWWLYDVNIRRVCMVCFGSAALNCTTRLMNDT